jgi:hypothetical protein
VIWALRHLINRFGKPQKIRMDNDPKFISKLTQSWRKVNEIEFQYIQQASHHKMPMLKDSIEVFTAMYWMPIHLITLTK